MDQRRSNSFLKILALVTGVIFLNMGFFVFELKVLDLKYSDQEVMEIISLVSTTGFEEEKDGASGSSTSSFGEEIVDLHITTHPSQTAAYFLLSSGSYNTGNSLFFDSCNTDIATPPPKLA
jgi:hypothetical protein